MAVDGLGTALWAALHRAPGLSPGVLWGAAILLGLLFLIAETRRCGLDPRVGYWMALIAAGFGYLTSHLVGLWVYGTYATAGAWLAVGTSGKSSFGGLFGGAAAALLYLRCRRAPLLGYLDAAAPALALGYAIGRVGCFANGDDFGTPTGVPWGVRFPEGTEAHSIHVLRGLIRPDDPLSLMVHPVQLYLAAFGVAIFIVLRSRKPPAPGRIFALGACLYGLARFGSEFLRGDSQPAVGPLAFPQACCLALVIGGILFLRRPAVGQPGATPPNASVAASACALSGGEPTT